MDDSFNALIKLQNSRKLASHFMVMVMQPDDIPLMEFHKGFNDWQDSQFTMFPFIIDPNAYLISKLWGSALIGWRRLFQSSKSYVYKILKLFSVSFQITITTVWYSLIYVCIFFQMHFNLVTIKLLSDFLERGAIFIRV